LGQLVFYYSFSRWTALKGFLSFLIKAFTMIPWTLFSVICSLNNLLCQNLSFPRSIIMTGGALNELRRARKTSNGRNHPKRGRRLWRIRSETGSSTDQKTVAIKAHGNHEDAF